MDEIPESFQLDDLPWQPFGGKTKGIFRKNLSAMTFSSGFKASLTWAKPGGEFPEHIDPYAHIFYIMKGKGEATIEGRAIPLKKGTALTVLAGKSHSYKNSGPGDLLLITLNIFGGGEKK